MLDRTPSSRKVVDLLELLLITECHAKRKGKQKGQRIRNATKTSVDDLLDRIIATIRNYPDAEAS